MPPQDSSSLLQQIQYLETAVKALVGAVTALGGVCAFLFFQLQKSNEGRLEDLRQNAPIVGNIAEAAKTLMARRTRR